jgi:hypothetical protein
VFHQWRTGDGDHTKTALCCCLFGERGSQSCRRDSDLFFGESIFNCWRRDTFLVPILFTKSRNQSLGVKLLRVTDTVEPSSLVGRD